jgi:hypothetical protein
MKTITTTTSVRKADASLDVKLNPVELSSKEIVSWGEAFPRPGRGTSRRVAEVGTSPDTEMTHSVWRTDATIGSVLGTLVRTAPVPTSD